MIATALALAALASGLLATAGYLVGVGRAGRELARLRHELSDSGARVDALAAVEELLTSVRTPERISQAMAKLKGSQSGLVGLPHLLDTIAESGRFSAMLLTDDKGLLIASSTQARHTEQLAGIASLILTLSERIVANNQPGLLSVLLRDESNQLVLHRIFRLPFTEERYILTALSQGVLTTPDALDPALARLEELLAPGADVSL